MDDPYDLVLGMFALAIAAVMLVAGELYLGDAARSTPQTYTPPPSVVASSINWRATVRGSGAEFFRYLQLIWFSFRVQTLAICAVE